MSLISKQFSKQKIAVAVLSVFLTALFISITAYIVQIIKNKDTVSPALPKLIGALLILSIICIIYLVVCHYFHSKQYAQLQKKVDGIDGVTKETKSKVDEIKFKVGEIDDVTRETSSSVAALREDNSQEHQGITHELQKVHEANNNVKGEISTLSEKVELVRAEIRSDILHQVDELKKKADEMKGQLMEHMNYNMEKEISQNNNMINELSAQLKSLETSCKNNNGLLHLCISQILLQLKKFEVLLPGQERSLAPSKSMSVGDISSLGNYTIKSQG